MRNARLCAAAMCLALMPAIAFAQDKFFDSNGVTIRYVDQGSGSEPIILLHGNGGSLQTWVNRGILPNLVRDYRVIAFDARGHGKSGKPHDPKQYGREAALDVVRLLDHLAIRQAHIVGYSMGAATTSHLLTLRPDRFLTATLIAGVGPFEWTAQQAREAEQEAMEREKECVSRSQIYRLAPLNAPKPSEDDIKAQSAACFADSNQDRFALAALRRSGGERVINPTVAAAVTVPTLGIVGSLDPNKVGLEALKKLRPNLRFIVVDGAVHGGDRGILTRPELMAALREFLLANRKSTR